MEINWDIKNDKIVNYSKNSYNTQLKEQNNRRNIQNTIKINPNTNHLGLYEVEQTTVSNKGVFNKQHKFNKEQLTQYLKEAKQYNYKIINGSANSVSNSPDIPLIFLQTSF